MTIFDSFAVIFKLEGGPSSSEGRLLVSYNGQWGSVCISKLETHDASVFCQLMGFKLVSFIYLRYSLFSLLWNGLVMAEKCLGSSTVQPTQRYRFG
jgi:hypothetical protein